MHTKEAIQFALTTSESAVMSLVDEASNNPTTFPTPNGGCHPLWVLGHLTLVEGIIPAVLFGEENPVGKWYTLFGENSDPVDNLTAYPSFTEVREKYAELRAKNLTLLASLNEHDLDKPTKAPPQGREKEFSTYGCSFLTLALHQAMHRSHLTDALRAAGHKPA
jgi:uncharacterized damage-inducible protein DinB